MDGSGEKLVLQLQHKLSFLAKNIVHPILPPIMTVVFGHLQIYRCDAFYYTAGLKKYTRHCAICFNALPDLNLPTTLGGSEKIGNSTQNGHIAARC